ncbi:helix-turn-helix domain-containing protein [Hymenobacter terricola]|uniref:helix-turn-helix domain-containing protein n=1 Tax=Hymenobacter terricola TaxID=2819236 RepID=UPI001B30979B|nr:AraC family transcriptional regulator [Hymenobacter terricola]
MTSQTIGNAPGLRHEAIGARCARAARPAAHEYPTPGLAPKASRVALVENIKNAIIELVYSSTELPKRRNSDHLSQRLSHDYTYLANVFSEATGGSIEQCIIGLKVRRVKELLLEDELNLTQIAYKLNYSNVGHLSNQFKKVTGLTPSFFKQFMHQRRLALECIRAASGNRVNLFCNPVTSAGIRRLNFVA